MGIIGAGEGAAHMRAVGVNERAGCRRDLHVGGGKACAGTVLLRRLSALAGQHHEGQHELSPSLGAGVCACC